MFGGWVTWNPHQSTGMPSGGEGVNIEVSQQDDSPLDPYKKTSDALHEEGWKPAPTKSSRPASSGSNTGCKSAKYIFWPVDIAGNTAMKSREIAHLLPAGQLIHKEWFGVAAVMLGLPKMPA